MKGIRIISNYRKIPDGYGNAATEFVYSLIENDFTDFSLVQAFNGEWPLSNNIIRQFENKHIDYDINLIILTADNVNPFFVEGKKNVLYTMFESTELPDHWPALCNRCDAVIVPSTFCKEVFEKSGVIVPIHIVPIPTNVNKFDNTLIHEELKEIVKNKFIFYSIFQWGERKNPKALLNSYYSSFGSNDDVLLILKTHLSGNNNESVAIENKVKEIRNNIKRNNNDYPKVLLISNNLNEDQIIQIHKVGNVCLSTTKGEGWNIPACAGALAGNHVIATNFSSHTDFLDTYNYFKYQIYDLVDYQLENCHSAGSLYTSNQKWASINVYELSRKMKKCYTDWKNNNTLGLEDKRIEYSNYLKKHYSYENIGKKLLAILNNLV